MLPTLYDYPWAGTKFGESFFVPALDPQETLLHGLRSALMYGLSRGQVRAVICIYKGLMGVMFTVKRSPRA